MLEPNKWYFVDAVPLPKNIVLNQKGKEIYTFKREHPEYGLMSITVLATNGNEARDIIDKITK